MPEECEHIDKMKIFKKDDEGQGLHRVEDIGKAKKQNK